MIRFVLEVRKKDGTEYPPNTLHHLCSGIARYLRANGHPTLDLYKDSAFADFRTTLDAEMKRLQHKGIGSKVRQAEALSEDDEEILWSKGLLGDHSPQALLNTMVLMIGLYFALRSGREHRELRFSSSQIEVVEKEGERAYLLYTEDASKNRPGGLRGRYIPRKSVRHYCNEENPSRCFVRLFKKYLSHCPPDTKRNSLYLQPLKKTTQQVWYSREPLRHNKLTKIVPEMCTAAGIQGFRTNHSLRASSATRLYAAGMDEQLIMERTGHRSTGGVWSYKRTTDAQQQAVSDILNCAKRPNTSTQNPTSHNSTQSMSSAVTPCTLSQHALHPPPQLPTQLPQMVLHTSHYLLCLKQAMRKAT